MLDPVRRAPPLLFCGGAWGGVPHRKVPKKVPDGGTPYAHLKKKALRIGGDPPLEGGTPYGKSSGVVGVEDRGYPPVWGLPPYAGTGFSGVGYRIFLGVPRFFIDALDR